jgi:metal-responsive CopG/Arc/MetJ family transcriptional regulator
MEKLEISLTLELMRRVDEIVELLSFGSREEFLMAAVRRLVDHYLILSESIARTS